VTTSKVDSFGSIRPSQFQYVKRFLVERNFAGADHPSCRVEIELADQVPFGARSLRVVFVDAVGIKIGDMNLLWGVMLRIRDVSDQQLEGIRYRAVDEESDVVSLRCADFEFSIVEGEGCSTHNSAAPA
jgi:hypothetical protein